MTYGMMGATTFVPHEDPIYVPSSEAQAWCTPTHPQPAAGCVPTEGLAKPTTATALSKFKALQVQLNRIAAVKGYAKIGVDGVLGSKTLALYNKATGNGLNSLDVLAMNTLAAGSAVLRNVTALADSAKAPVSVSAPPSKYRTPTVNANGSVNSSQGIAASIPDSVFGLISSPMGLLLAAGLAFGAYKLATGGKKGGKGRVKRSKPKRSRAKRSKGRVKRRANGREHKPRTASEREHERSHREMREALAASGVPVPDKWRR